MDWAVEIVTKPVAEPTEFTNFSRNTSSEIENDKIEDDYYYNEFPSAEQVRNPSPELVLIKEENHGAEGYESPRAQPYHSLQTEFEEADQDLHGNQHKLFDTSMNYNTHVTKEYYARFISNENQDQETGIFTNYYNETESDFNCKNKFSKGLAEFSDENEKSQNPDSEDLSWCERCSKFYKSSRSTHYYCKMKPRRIRPFKCSHCERCFLTTTNLLAHLEKIFGTRPLMCMVCGNMFGEEADMNEHQCQMESEQNKKMYKCSDCGKTFADKPYLRKHQLRHLGLKPYRCETCGKRFSESSHLSRHQLTHTEVKELQCFECGKSFSLKANLIVHQRIHLGIKPYQCRLCGKGFYQNVNRLAHERSQHTGEKVFPCPNCKEAFQSKYLLKKHISSCIVSNEKADLNVSGSSDSNNDNEQFVANYVMNNTNGSQFNDSTEVSNVTESTDDNNFSNCIVNSQVSGVTEIKIENESWG